MYYNRPYRLRVFGLFLLWLFLDGVVSAQESEEKISDTALRVPGIFNSVLPGTEEKNKLKFILHPHLGDISKRDYIRTDLGLSYGLTKRWDVMTKTRFYFGHGLKNASFGSDLGLADYEIETKYRIGEFLLPDWESAISLAYASPIGTPEPAVTDGLVHRALTLSYARPLELHPNVRIFWGLTTDIIGQTDVIGRLDDKDLRDSNQKFSGGFVYTQGTTNYTFEAGYSTTRIWGSTREDVYSIRPGIVFRVPPRYTLGSEGEWIFGAAIPVSYGPDGIDVGVAVKLRLDFDFKRMIRGDKKSSN
jgi:hypothetical protein